MASPIGQTVVQVKGIKRLARNVSRLPISITRESKKFRELYARDWQKELKRKAPIGATGKLKESIKVMPGKSDNEIIVTIESPYAFPQAFGQRPHGVYASQGHPGTATLGEWIRFKGGTPIGGFFKYNIKRPAYGAGFYNRTEKLMFKRLKKNAVDGVKAAIKNAGFKKA